MRFARHLISQLTPEWRKHYIHYDDLKVKIYDMAKSCQEEPASSIDGKQEGEETLPSSVDVGLQNLLFQELSEQLLMVESFFKAREANLSLTLRELCVEVDKYEVLRNSPQINSRITRRKKENLKLLLSEFYLNVCLLQNFQQLNHTGFRKILKKHDKVIQSTRGMQFFQEQVCENYFWKTPEIAQLIAMTESLMIEKMEDGNRSKAMNRLRVPPLESKDIRSHWATLRAGWLMGIIFISFFVIILGIIFRPADSWSHVTPTVRGLRVGLLLTVWFYGFAINTFEWRRSGVNNVLIFEFNPRDYLNFVQLFECASVMGVIFLIGVYFTVFSYWLHMPEWAGPVIMLGLTLVIALNPLPIIYHRSRLWMLKKLGRVALAPFFFVQFADFWIADQMNSLAIILLDVEQLLCYLLIDLTVSGDNIQCGTVSYGLRPFVAVLPAWFRFAQCLRRYYDTRQAFPHLVNAGKYSTTFFVVFFGSMASGLRVGDVDLQNVGYYVSLVLWIVAHIVSTTYTFTWDIKMDWGLFEGKYKLRSELIYSRKIYYVLGVIEDLVFRSLWTVNITFGNRGAFLIESNILGTILAILEVFRRFVWNFFRLENEHVNNIGEFRAVRDISIHPVDLSKVDAADEATVEGTDSLSNQLARRTSVILSQISTSVNPPKLHLRKSSLHTIAEAPSELKNGSTPVLSRQHAALGRTDSTQPIIEANELYIDSTNVEVIGQTIVTAEVYHQETTL